MGRASLQGFCGLAVGLLCGGWFGLGPAIGALAQRSIGVYEAGAPVLIFAVLAPSMLKLLRHDGDRVGRFTLHAFFWFSRLRLAVVGMTTLLVSLLYQLPLVGPNDRVWAGLSASALLGNRYLLAVLIAGIAALALRHRSGRTIGWFLRLPDAIEAVGNLLTRFTLFFGFLVGVYIVSIPDLMAAGAFAPHPVAFRWLPASADTPMAIYLVVAATTALLCLLLHAALLAWARWVLPGFSIRGYIRDYWVRVYPLIWSTGAESLAIPANLATLRRYGGGVPDAMRDLTVGLAATLNLNGTPICCLVLIPAVCMAIGHPLSVLDLLACLPVIFVVSYAIPGIPGELAIFAGPITLTLGLGSAEREAFLVLFLAWQLGLPDAFRSAGSATDAVPSTLLLTHLYAGRPSRTCRFQP